MSVEVMSLVFRRYPGGGNERLLALAIADHARADGSQVYPSVSLLAEMTKQSERSVQRLLHEMLASGWLQLVRKSTGRRGDTNEYRISPDWLAGGDAQPPQAVPDRRTIAKATGDKLAPVEALTPVENVSTTGDTQGLSGDTDGLSGDTAVSPNPSLPIHTLQTPQPPVQTGGSEEKPEARSPVPLPPATPKDRQRWRWTEGRSGIEARGEDLGLGRWDEGAFGRGGETFPAYTARVYVAHLAALGATVSVQQLREALAVPKNTDAEALRRLAHEAKNNETPRSSQ